MKSTTYTEKWGSGVTFWRNYGPNENIAGGHLHTKIDTRHGYAQIYIQFPDRPWEHHRYTVKSLSRLQEWLEIEGVVSCYYAEKIVQQIASDVLRIKEKYPKPAPEMKPFNLG